MFMSHAMVILHGVIAKDGELVCDSEPLRCPRCGAGYDLHSNETGPSQLQFFRYIASENVCNEHPRHHTSIVLGPRSLLNQYFATVDSRKCEDTKHP